jgi:hypothetical protein
MIGWNYNKDMSSEPPPRKVNGGLFTGESFIKDAPWGNVPIVPTSESMSEMIPNKMAKYHYPSAFRLGNNSDPTPGLVTCLGFPAIKSDSTSG